MDYIKLNLLCIKWHNQQSEKGTGRIGQIFANNISNKELTCRMNSIPTTQQLKKKPKPNQINVQRFQRHFSKEKWWINIWKYAENHYN